MYGKGKTPGVLITFLIAVISYGTWWSTKSFIQISPLLWAFVISILATNLIPMKGSFDQGIELISTKMLKGAIALLGITISALVWLKLGLVGVIIVLLNLSITFVFGMYTTRKIGLTNSLSILISSGTAICGASAIAAISPAIRAKSEEVGLALACITLFGLVAMFMFPILFLSAIGSWLSNNVYAFGIWTGTGIHETAQVIAASSQIPGAVGMALLAKSIRIFMIGPMSILATILFNKIGASKTGDLKITIPWFAVAFIIFSLINTGFEISFGGIWVDFMKKFLKPPILFVLAWSFAGIGFKVKLKDIISIGPKAFIGGLVVALFAGVTSLLLVKYVWLFTQ
jgi:uncharacterized integral membrane protein (TIGR00698 family)